MHPLQALEADKYAIMRRCAIPARDLRILDPLLSYPSTLLGREKAIVVNLEHIKVRMRWRCWWDSLRFLVDAFDPLLSYLVVAPSARRPQP